MNTFLRKKAICFSSSMKTTLIEKIRNGNCTRTNFKILFVNNIQEVLYKRK